MRIVNDGSTERELTALGILNEYFADEINGSAKAFCLHREFAHRMSGGVLTEEMISQVVMEILIALKLRLDRTAGQVEYVCGERRDTVRGKS